MNIKSYAKAFVVGQAENAIAKKKLKEMLKKRTAANISNKDGAATDSEPQPIVTTSASIEANQMLYISAVVKAKELYHEFYDISHHWSSVKVRINIATKCVIKTAETMIGELQGHSDLHGYWQDTCKRMSVIERIQFWQYVKDEMIRVRSVA